MGSEMCIRDRVAKLAERKICRISASSVFKPLAKDAEFLHHTLVARKVANLPEIETCRISAFNFFNRPVALAIIYSIFSAAFGPAVKNTRIMCTIGGLGRYIGRYVDRYIGRLSTDSRALVGRQSADSRPTVDRWSADM